MKKEFKCQKTVVRFQKRPNRLPLCPPRLIYRLVTSTLAFLIGISYNINEGRGVTPIREILCSVIIVLFFAASYPLQAGEMDIRLNAPHYSFKKDDKGRIVLYVSGWSKCGQPGEPSLPALFQRYLLPPDADVSTVTLRIVSISERSMDMGKIAPTPIMLADGKSSDWEDGENPDAYSSDRFFPSSAVEIVGTGAAGRWRFVRIRFSPFRYNPHKGRLYIAVSITIRLRWEEGTPSPYPFGGESVKIDFVNYTEMCGLYEKKVGAWASATTLYDMLIITPQTVIDSGALTDYISHRTAQGYSIVVESVEDIEGNYTGAELADKIRDCIKSYYASSGIKYVLLVGNPDPDDNESSTDSVGSVPMKMCWARKGSGDPNDWSQSPTDYYYSDLTGNWDADGDGYYGEAYKVYDVYGETGDLQKGGLDIVSEVVVGRVPFDNTVDIKNYFQKLIDYENSLTGYVWGSGTLEWRKRALIATLPMDASTPSYELGELMKGRLFEPPGYVTTRAYRESYGLYEPPEISPCSEDVFCAEWQKGYGLVLWTTHGLAYSAGDVISSDRVGLLNDSLPSVVCAICCKNATPEVNSLAKQLLRNGALSVFASTRVIWYVPGWNMLDDGGCHSLGYELLRRIVEGERVGDALDGARLWYIDRSPNTPYDYFNIFAFVLYGDPLVRIGIPDIRPLNLPRAKAGKYYEVQLNGIGGDDFVFGVAPPGLLPEGLGLTPEGLLKGSVAIEGRYRFTIYAQSSTGAYVEREYLLDVRERKGYGCLGFSGSDTDAGTIFSILLVPFLILLLRTSASFKRRKVGVA